MAKSILATLRRSPTRRELSKIWGPSVVLMIAGFGIAWWFVEPAPPSHLKIAAGPKQGNYYATALKYAEIFAREGVILEVLETAGTAENYRLLTSDPSVHVALVQGGAQPEQQPRNDFEAIASLYFEPLWIFHRVGDRVGRLRDFQHKRISIGLPESGTELLMMRLLAANGLVGEQWTPDTPGDAVTIHREKAHVAVEQLLAGQRDAVCMVTSPANPLVEQLLTTPDVTLLPIERSETYRLLFPALSGIRLRAGVLNLADMIPPSDIPLISPTANLVCTPELHDAFVPLLLSAATQVHTQGNLLVTPGTFPSLDFVEYAVHHSAADYFKAGPTFLNRFLPFWAASLANRMKIMLVPLLTLAIPLIKVAPPVYRWRIRSRIYRWYGLLRVIDQEQLRANSTHMRQRHLEQLSAMADELNAVNVPLSFMEEFYNLHLHINLIRERVIEGGTTQNECTQEA